MPPPKLPKKRSKDNMMNKIKEKKGFAKRCLKGFLVHGGLLLVVSLYAVIGAYILIDIEIDQENENFEEKIKAGELLNSSQEYIIDHAWYHSSQPHTEKQFKFLVSKNLNLYRRFLVLSALNQNYDGKPYEWNYDWTFPKSLLFTTTTMGAIGYGHIAPKTIYGQFFTIYYGMIGIPLLLLFLANIGEFLASSLRYIYSRFCCRLCRIRRAVSTAKSVNKLKPKLLWKEEVGHEEFMPTEFVDVPIVVNLCLIFVYLMLGGALFSQWEGWQIHEAAYFTFITLTTIGFGDYVPGNSFVSGTSSFVSSLKMIVTIAFCMFGMALLSMAINLMQEQLVRKSKYMAKSLGISSDKDNDTRVKYNVIHHEPGTVVETPQENYLYQNQFLQDQENENDYMMRQKRAQRKVLLS